MIVGIDFETSYSSEFSLRRMKMVDYILDARFQTIMCAVKLGTAPSQVYVGHDAVAAALDAIDWSTTAMVSHNMLFDGAILSWHFGHVPALYCCTLSMARALTHAVTGKSSLAKVAEYLGLGKKGTEVVNAMGKRLEDFTPFELDAYAGYCNNDNELAVAIFHRFMTVFPKPELRVVDLVQRMFIEPQLLLNPGKLEVHLVAVREAQAAVMAKVALLDPSVFSSSIKFAALLEGLGVMVPEKWSVVQHKMIPALARNDREFKELCEDDSQTPVVQAVLAARLAVKSTLEETRTVTLLGLSRQPWSGRGAGWMPVPLRYSGAHTHRFSGDGGYNFQNLKRGSPIKAAIEAPPGYRIVHRDSSQIEARMLAWMAGCDLLLDAFAAGRDVYCEFGSIVHGRPITKADAIERFGAKTCVLGLGYGTGPPRLRHSLFIGNGGISMKVDLEEAENLVATYRRTYHEIPALWRSADKMLARMITRTLDDSVPVRGVTPGVDALWLPSGLCIAYPHLRRDLNQTADKTETVYDGPFGSAKHIYGAKVCENVSQALSRIVITDIMTRVHFLTGYHPCMSTHDSLDYLVPEADASWWDTYLAGEFAVRPGWAPDLPLASDGGYGATLADAEKQVNT